MTPYYSDSWLTVYQGDCRAVIAAMEPASVHCVVTSPPYWGLRDYGTATWIGGDEGCDHAPTAPPRATRPASGLTGGKATVDAGTIASGTCRRCGAVREDGQLGLEATPEAYVAAMVEVFRAVRRVLRDDGTVWLNLGDSYAAARGGTYQPAETLAGGVSGRMADGARVNRDRHDGYSPSRNAGAIGLKHKDLVGIPWRVAFALQADGWYLRSDIIWAKPNPMPESVTDRPTKAHEYLFLLSKSARYYFDADAVREADAGTDHPRAVLDGQPSLEPSGGLVGAHRGIRTLDGRNGSGRNLRSVWTIATAPYPGAHFATFPPKLVERCVKAGTSDRGVCSECGAPWERVVERTKEGERHVGPKDANPHRNDGPDVPSSGLHSQYFTLTATTTGWQPSCGHEAITVPAVVLDPFAGSGTTGMVAQSLGRRAVLIDLNGDYLVQAMTRNADIPLGLEIA